MLIEADLDNGVVVIDTEGNVVHHLEGINDSMLKLGDDALWLPDNSILLTLDDRYILRTPPPYTSLTLVKEMNYEQWGNLYSNRDGSKISLFIGNHIYLMDIDGSNLIQVTDSNRSENFAKFSPNDKYLLVRSDYIYAPVSGRSVWNLKIIPNDGRKYHLENDKEAILVQPANENIPATVSGKSFWVP